jgi:hypothetical protein
VLGTRGRWLAARNPADWGYVGGDADRSDPESVWQTGTKAERRVALRSLRQADPEKARSLVASTWASEPADERSAIVEAFAEGLSMADEPFLEAALDDRGKTVRRAAAELLPRLAGSRFAARMVERARACMRWSGKTAVVEPPKACDAAMVRDGVEPKPPVGTGERAWWLRQVLAAAPLSAWSAPDYPPPDCLVESLGKNEWIVDLWVAWARAATRERNEDWAEALLRNLTKEEYGIPGITRELLEALSPDRRDALLLEYLRAETAPFGPRGSPAFRLLYLVWTPIGEELAREVLRRIREEVVGRGEKPNFNQFLWSYVSGLGLRVPPSLADEVEDVAATDELVVLGQFFNQFVNTLRFRREMHEEFAR